MKNTFSGNEMHHGIKRMDLPVAGLISWLYPEGEGEEITRCVADLPMPQTLIS
jgi:hypothetical protein